MIGVVQQVIFFSKRIKDVVSPIELSNSNGWQRLEFQILWSCIRKANVILGVVIASTGNQAVITPKPQSLSELLEQHLWHGCIVNKANRIRLATLL